MDNLLYWFTIFFVYSVFGWFVESVWVSVRYDKFINRGFLIGPYCPIYGLGSLMIISYLEQYKSNLLTVFLLAIVICSVLEYLTSYIMEKLFKARWWDYSYAKFNLNGRICGKNAILFGIGGVFIIYVAHPFLNGLFQFINPTVLLIISIIFFVIFLTDVIVSLNVINRFKKTITSVDVRKDSTQDFTKMVNETLIESKRVFQRRLLSAFPNSNINKLKELSMELKTRLKK